MRVMEGLHHDRPGYWPDGGPGARRGTAGAPRHVRLNGRAHCDCQSAIGWELLQKSGYPADKPISVQLRVQVHPLLAIQLTPFRGQGHVLTGAERQASESRRARGFSMRESDSVHADPRPPPFHRTVADREGMDDHNAESNSKLSRPGNGRVGPAICSLPVFLPLAKSTFQ